MRASLYTVRGIPAGQLSVMARPRGGDWLPDEVRALRKADVCVLASLLTAEEEREFELSEEAEYCRPQGIIFQAFPIVDRSVPPFSTATFSFLQQLNQYRSEGKHVVLHCRQGLGRAVLMAASLLVLAGVPPEQAFDLLSKARGYPVPETEEQRAWVVAFARRLLP